MKAFRLGQYLRLLYCGLPVLVCALPTMADTPTPVGRWLTQNGNGVVEIAPCDKQLCGKLVWFASQNADGRKIVDTHNPKPELRARALCGLAMLGEFKQSDGNRWNDGWIYSPENGKTYSASITMENGNTLQLRGYIGISLFGETQTWTRADPAFPLCKD